MRAQLRRLYHLLLPKVFARHDLKLILTSSIFDLEKRARGLLAATDFFQIAVRSIRIEAPFGKSLLAIAPHQDDEAIGCGGAIAAQVAAGGKAHIVLLHDGADGHEEYGLTRAELSALRNAESSKAAAVVGIEGVQFLGHADLAASRRDAAGELRGIIQERGVDAVLSPFPLDATTDHVIAAEILADALSGISWPVRVLTYEVWGLCVPNVILTIDHVVEQKRKMLEAFTWAHEAADYTNTTLGLNQFRARHLPRGACRYAECFFELPKDDYIAFMRRLAEARA